MCCQSVAKSAQKSLIWRTFWVTFRPKIDAVLYQGFYWLNVQEISSISAIGLFDPDFDSEISIFIVAYPPSVHHCGIKPKCPNVQLP